MSERFLSRLRLARDGDAGLIVLARNATGGRIESLPVGLAKVNAIPWVLSYHIRNVPVLSTIEMSPSFGFTLPRNRERVPWRKSLFSRDDSELEEGCDVGSGRGAGGKGQRPFPRPAL